MKAAFLLVIVLAASFGQVLLKLAMRERQHLDDSVMDYVGLLADIRFLAAVALYAFASVSWLWVLKHFPLGRAYPVIALTFVFVPLLGQWLVGEALAWTDFAGMTLIMAGVLIIGARL